MDTHDQNGGIGNMLARHQLYPLCSGGQLMATKWGPFQVARNDARKRPDMDPTLFNIGTLLSWVTFPENHWPYPESDERVRFCLLFRHRSNAEQVVTPFEMLRPAFRRTVKLSASLEAKVQSRQRSCLFRCHLDEKKTRREKKTGQTAPRRARVFFVGFGE